MVAVPLVRRAGVVALAGLLLFTLVACGGGNDDPESPATSVPPATIISGSTAALEAPRVDLTTSEATTYYPVTGTTTEDIFASIEANGPTDNVGQQGSGLTSVDWEYKWTGDKAPSGECSIRELTVSAAIVVELPQHQDEALLPVTLLSNWQEYAQGVADHEQRHVDIYLEGAQDIQAAMREIDVQENCDLLEEIIDEVWNDQQARINALQDSFHNDENARLAASRGPLELEIDANRDKLESLQAQIAVLDQQISTLQSEIAVFDNEVANIDTQIKQINQQFPNELPETIRQRLEQLIEQSNDLLSTYNQKVEEHNAAVFARNALSDQYDALLLETNQMVDEYNWTR